jgi:thiol-disulfide isomerase/thioredoxin
MSPSLLALALTLVAASPNESLLDLPVRGATGPSRTVRAMVGDGPAVVSLWATYCAPCKVEVPALNRAAERYGEQGLRVIGVVVDTDDPEEVRAVSDSWGIEYPVVWPPADERAHVASLLPRGLPTTFFVRGDRVRRHEGVLDDAGIDRMVRQMLEASPAKPPDTQATLTLEPAAW